MKKISLSLVMLALALAVGLALVSCDNGSTGDGGSGGSISLYSANLGSRHSVSFIPPGSITTTRSGDYTLAINGTNLNIVSAGTSGKRFVLEFASSAFPLTVGSRYTVTVAYIGSAVAPFTYTETVTCK
jgi:hypothetical protein